MATDSIFDYSNTQSRSFEWQTWAAIVAFWIAFGLLTWHWALLPWWLLCPIGAYLVCLHGSLQHEAVHGHPTRNPLVNELLLFPAISLWFPYRRYRKLHLTHHRNDDLTDPAVDPETSYMDPQAWAGTPAALRLLFSVNNSMLGRFVLGPTIATVRFFASEARLMAMGDRPTVKAWALHGLGIALLYVWVSIVCGMPFLYYIFAIAYWGNSLTMMRSYAEHRAHDEASCRIIVVETNPVVAFLYLNNNLHMAHHEAPRLPWYRLPSFYASNRERLLRENCAYLMRGYLAIARRWLLKPKEPVAHPNMQSLHRIKQLPN
ncbi:MAG: fatty acid desaturase [Pseudomonadota bacterium]|nr:fatty acid desaturase [Pseudomonadota bacterium]